MLRKLDHVKHLLPELPSHESVSAARYTGAVVEELKRDGSLNRAFFDALRDSRPNRIVEIDEIAGHFHDPAVAPRTTPGARRKDTGLGPVWPPPDAPDGPGEAELRPTLSEWCREHRGWLTVLLAFPLVGVPAAFGLGQLAPGVAAKFTAEPWAPFVLAAQIVQMMLSGCALFVFAGWVSPTHPSVFGVCPTYARFAARQEAALDRGEVALRAALGAAAGELHMKEWLKGARRGSRQLSEQLLALWLAWALLYFCIVAGAVAPAMFGTPDAVWLSVLDAAATMLNNAAAGVMLILFWVMTYVTVPIQHVGPQGFVPRQSTRVRLGVRVALAVIFAAQLCATNIGSEAARQAWKYAFELLSGVGSSVIMALLFGRFDSKLLGVPLSALVCLYIWAAIQASWPVLDLIHLDGRPETELLLKDIAQVALYGYAWFAKCVFFVLCAWLFHTGRFEFFLLRLRRLQTTLAADWRRVTQ